MENATQTAAGEREGVRRDLFLDQARARLDQGQSRLALEMAEARLRRLPGDIDARTILCQALIQMGRIDEARAILREVEDILLGLARLYAVMGDFSLKRDAREEALTYYRKFLALNVSDGPLVREVSEKVRILQPDRAEADGPDEEPPLEVEDIDPGFQTLTLAELYIRQGHLEMGADVLKKILEREPGNEKVRERYREVQAAIARALHPERRNARAIATLSGWLATLEGMRTHAT